MSNNRKKSEIYKYGGQTVLHTRLDIPVDIIIKRNSKYPPDDILDRTSYAWKIEYKGQQFGDYIYITDDMSNLDDPVTDNILKEVYDVILEQAENSYLSRILLVDCLASHLVDELYSRLREKYMPFYGEYGGRYVVNDEDGKREYSSKYTFKYLFFKVRFFVIKKALSFISKLLGVSFNE